MLLKLKNAFLYAAVDRTSFNRVKTKIQKANLTMVTILSTFATFLIASMLVSSFRFEGIKQNKIVYVLGLILSLTILISSITFAKRHPALVTFLVYLSFSIYYLYGIVIGTITDSSGKTVTFMVMLVFMPILFIDRPIHSISITMVFVTVFIVLCFKNKEGSVLSVDVIDSIVYFFLGSASGFVINHMKLRGYVLEQQLHEISRIDQLTQMKNRNAFEFEHDSMPNLCKFSLGIVYIDVNGLHEMNNEHGHEFGDKMLKYISSAVKLTFSDELTYRIGGDEFVAFVPDKTSEEVELLLHEMVKKIEQENYHVAVGYEISRIRHISLDDLINKAEKKMLNDKNQFYKNLATRKIRNEPKY